MGFPVPEISGGGRLLINFIKVIEPLVDKIYVITGGSIRVESSKVQIVGKQRGWDPTIPFWIRIVRHVVAQIRSSLNMTKVAKGYEIVILYAGGQYYLMAAITAKFLRKKLVLVNFGSYIKQANKSIFYRILAINEILITRLSDRVVFESPRVIDSYGLGKYEEKNRVADHRFLNTNVFSITKALNNRERKIGYFGRILKGKGVLEFARSLPLVIKQNTHVSFDIIGGGDFIDDVKHEVERNGSLSKVTFTGYINQEDVPKLLNELTVLVFPSPLDGWEGLPTVILEAMACGTPVLATPTGGVLDVIEDGITGFIMEDNSPECIAKNIVRVLNCASLGDIVKRARDFIEQNYNFETTVANYRKILLDL